MEAFYKLNLRIKQTHLYKNSHNISFVFSTRFNLQTKIFKVSAQKPFASFSNNLYIHVCICLYKNGSNNRKALKG